jgi:preprotein translocase subunit SecA
MNVQREVIYGQRRMILEGADLRDTIIAYLHNMVTDNVNMYCPEGLHPTEWDLQTLFELLDEVFPLSVYARPDTLKGKKREELEDFLFTAVDRTYEDREQELGVELMRDLERHIALRAINSKWMDHLDAMDYLREGIGLRGYAQVDPLVAYKKEGYDMFQQMLANVQDEIVRMVYRVQVHTQQEPYRNPYRNVTLGGEVRTPMMGFRPEDEEGLIDRRPDMFGSAPVVQAKNKVGRNDLCPCGSGKKYKKCCLREDEQV